MANLAPAARAKAVPSLPPLASRVGIAALVALGLAACGAPSTPPLRGPSAEEAFGGMQCDAVRPQTEPDLMAWDPGSRLKLAKLRDEGVVAVRYQVRGCNVELEVLPCVAGDSSSYAFKPYRANEHKVAHDARELYAQLPVGAARLAANVKGNRALRTDYMLAGVYGLPTGTSIKTTELRGPREACSRATHVVSAVYVGAFAMGAGESRAIEASAGLLGLGGGAGRREDVESLGEEGSAEACQVSQAEAKADARCAVPLRIGLLPLERVAEGTAPAPSAAPAAAGGSGELAAILVGKWVSHSAVYEFHENLTFTLVEAEGCRSSGRYRVQGRRLVCASTGARAASRRTGRAASGT